jgi:FkbM family methyltransferase
MSRVIRRVKRLIYAPAIEISATGGLLTLGSEYGSWTFEPSADLQNSIIVSCGLGEDASFDVEFASRFHAKVILVDPTPRALRHFEEIQERLGKPLEQSYVEGGKQPATSYDLSEITPGQLILEPFALWVEETRLRFFAPPNPDHVSHSIVNYQNGYSMDSPYIEVPAITPEVLLGRHGLSKIALMKMDIEGAEIQVIPHLLEKAIFPRQILVEFDEMSVPSGRSKKKIEDTDSLLRQAGYVCRHYNGIANFLYVRG